MKKPSDKNMPDEDTFTRLIGLGANSLQKSYYPLLQKKIRELEKSEHRYRLLAENISDVIWMLDLNFCFRYVSPSIRKMTGFSPGELKGQTVDRLLTPESTKLFLNSVTPVIESQEALKNLKPMEMELQQTGKDGCQKWIAVVISIFYHEIEKESRILGVSRDITQKKIAESENTKIQAQLLQAQKMESIGTLAGGIAHDFNNLLTIINGYADIALMQMDEAHSLIKELTAIRHAGKRAEELTRQLLGFSRKQIYNPVLLNINQVISSMDTILRRLIGEDISVETILGDVIEPVNADQAQVEQIFTNLVINARDALKGITRENFKKRITIETGQTLFGPETHKRVNLNQPGPYVFFSVSDNGTGMAKRVKEKIFEPFFTTKSKGEGTGLGLSMIYGIVKQNKGGIQVYSEIDQGTMFKIYWPVSHETTRKVTPASSVVERLSGNETIMVVEDDKDVCAFAANSLLSLGYQVYKAFNGEQALQIIEREHPRIDLILTDLVMPELNGTEFAKKALALLPYIKIIYVSGYTDNHIVHDGLLEEGVNFIQKPYSQKTLAKMIRTVLGKKEDDLNPF